MARSRRNSKNGPHAGRPAACSEEGLVLSEAVLVLVFVLEIQRDLSLRARKASLFGAHCQDRSPRYGGVFLGSVFAGVETSRRGATRVPTGPCSNEDSGRRFQPCFWRFSTQGRLAAPLLPHPDNKAPIASSPRIAVRMPARWNDPFHTENGSFPMSIPRALACPANASRFVTDLALPACCACEVRVSTAQWIGRGRRYDCSAQRRALRTAGSCGRWHVQRLAHRC